MTTPGAVRDVALALPRAYEREVRGRAKLRVKQIVFAAFSGDESLLGFGFPKDARDGLVASDPDVFFLPGTADLRYHWVCAHVARLPDDEMRELVTDAWRMCVPRMLHDLPDLSPPAARVWGLVEQQEWGEVRPLLHPDVRLGDGAVEVRGRTRVLAHLADHPTPRPPTSVEVRDGQLYRWSR